MTNVLLCGGRGGDKKHSSRERSSYHTTAANLLSGLEEMALNCFGLILLYQYIEMLTYSKLSKSKNFTRQVFVIRNFVLIKMCKKYHNEGKHCIRTEKNCIFHRFVFKKPNFEQLQICWRRRTRACRFLLENLLLLL